ncbi:MAG: histidinol dehydrogenase [Proteobacteria bacterium]|nr:histidinol dehydrogenase [Pseudomonadota bacterium]MBI3498830.1 histidinol dehydrogenase [Pseudomonadota bacterium]
MPRRLDARSADFERDFCRLLADREGAVEDVAGAVAAIIAEVRQRGDQALIELTLRFDRLELTQERFRIGEAEIEAALATVPKHQLAALDLAARRIEAFHRRQLPADLRYRDEDGVDLAMRWHPLDSVGLYVPGGLAAYPSSVLMNALPARVAGVERVAMTVPTPEGRLNPLVLAAARRAGIREIYRLGGAQAVAALAYGTETIRPVDKIVGPGNIYVATAKRQVFGHVGIDAFAGPSEIVVIADRNNDPGWIAADLLSQAEHDPTAQAILITDDTTFAEAVAAAAERHLGRLERAPIAGASWRDHGAVIIVDRIEAAVTLINRLAPEHLELAIDDPEAVARQVKHAGAIFLGRHTPEAVGDYVAGPNHVLPTSRTARFSSGLGVLDFMKRTTLVGCDVGALSRIGPAAVTLAEAEGLGAHALSVALRLGPQK